MAGRGVIRLGDPTTGGGKVISCALGSFYTVMNIPGAVYGDMATCLKHKGVFPFVECDNSTTFNDRGVVLEGHKLACGCSAISTVSVTHTVAPSAPQFAPAAAAASMPAMAGDGNLAQAAYGDPREWTADTGDGSATPRHVLVTLRIGVFFDGTGNNADNAFIGEQCRARARNEAEHTVLLAGCEHSRDISYNNSQTNIVKLFNLYPNDADKIVLDHSGDYFLRVYVEGIGTYSGKGDSLSDAATGAGGDSGMYERVEQAFHRLLKRVLGQFSKTHGDAYVGGIELDVFGFSRGAAAARHFLHEVNRKAMGPLGTVIPGSNLKLKPGFQWASDLRAGFVGLYESVAHLGIGPDRPVKDQATRGLYLGLPEGCASRGVVHLTARDEHRLNFPLTSAALPYRDIPLPGVHSDLGGGYLDEARELVYLTEPVLSREPLIGPLQASRAYRQASRQLLVERARDPANAASMHVHAWDAPDGSAQMERFGIRTVAASVRMERTLSSAYANVTLRVMHQLAAEAGIPWKQSPDDLPSLRLPEELKPIAAKLLAYAHNGGDMGLTPSEDRLLRQRYLHCSAHWNLAQDEAVSGLTVLYINRPTANGKRVVFPNDGDVV
ncbi:hypothetical protein ASG87_16590 [Frateuria sp. Soil773]|uniref:PAAR domain-containing protein n=1 Tax=Frateuria sp. Soil773 TaxID=1736407 RepID=UPI0006F709A3|nr:PAAR domain-containing protein [Frateuria sp. Soil773]KRE96604.1 hypothetical protein ASG87_16590 [Frateuria sp. Soil773]